HHEDVSFEECPLGCLVHAANVLAHQAGFALGAPVLYEMSPRVRQSLGIPEAQYEGIQQAVVQEVMRVQEALRI
ncbi:MAG: hypothetical protein RMK45_05310, partial [Armatimonadota bacterium]|nr:hypothetical protein [Armatimonadota bacterium]